MNPVHRWEQCFPVFIPKAGTNPQQAAIIRESLTVVWNKLSLSDQRRYHQLRCLGHSTRWVEMTLQRMNELLEAEVAQRTAS